MNRWPTIPVAPRMPIFCRMSLYTPVLPAPSPDPNRQREQFCCEDSVSFSFIEMNAEGRVIRPRHLKMKLSASQHGERKCARLLRPGFGSSKEKERHQRIAHGVVCASAAFVKSSTRKVRRTHALSCGRL